MQTRYERQLGAAKRISETIRKYERGIEKLNAFLSGTEQTLKLGESIFKKDDPAVSQTITDLKRKVAAHMSNLRNNPASKGILIS